LTCQCLLKSLQGVLAADAEHDALQRAALVEVAAHLLHLDARGLVDRKAADAGSESDEA
jgi:hypothetical protein